MNSAIIPYIAAIIAFGSVLMLAYGIVGYLGNTANTARLRERISGTPAGSVSGEAMNSLWKSLSGTFERLGGKIGPTDVEEIAKNRIALVRAGLRTANAVMKFQGAKGFLALLLAGGFLVCRFMFLQDLGVPQTCFAAVVAASIGVYGPELWLRRRITQRQQAVSDELPDALDLLVVCVESGMGLDQAIERVCDELRKSGPVISSELKQLTLELRAGKARQDALRALSERVGIDSLSSLTSLLVQADTFGISVGRTLRVYSDDMRTKRSQRAEEKAAKLPVMLLLPLILFILPALFIAIMGPAVLIFIDLFAKMGQ